jgi:hypothetical protein
VGIWFLSLKFVLSALIIVCVSELAKRTGWLGGLVASLPLVSILSLTWLYLETKDMKAVSDLSYSILWFILPSLVLFLILPVLLKRGLPFFGALAMASTITLVAYAGFFILLQKVGIKL